MDAKSIGKTIANLRKKSGMTQQTLAQKLDISDKTVSKWENGQGYPDITIFPMLAALFGVTIDSLMLGEKKGIAIAGNLIADIVKNIDTYPKKGMMAKVSDISYAVGGCVPNTAINLTKIDRSIPISVFGKAGTDEYGRYILSQLQQNGIDVGGIIMSDKTPTSFCDVMSMPTGERTFFHKKGANAEFLPDDIDIDSLTCEIFHIGYIFLLDKFDEDDVEYGTVMARFLKAVQEKGIKTSIDVVSDTSEAFKQKVVPALKYCNYAIMNEIESSMITDLAPFNEDKSLNIPNIRKTMEIMAEYGVKDKIIIHCKEAGFCYDVKTGEFIASPSLNIPKEAIKGSVGAGDAFCAGALYGIYNNFSNKEILDFASSAAACNLFAENSIDGMKSAEEIEKMAAIYGRKEMELCQ